MSDWQERITRETAPSIRVEHELRYRVAAPLIAGSAVWADLGCGNGLAAAAALNGSAAPKAILVDVEQAVVERAGEELGLTETKQLVADLTSGADLQTIADALLAVEGERAVTCFEVVEHLETFVPLIEWAGKLARDGAATFVLSVPNDAFWSIQNPHHRTSWGEGAFEELRRLLPERQTLLRQVALSGSALVGWDASETGYEMSARAGGEGTVPTHFLAAFGPRHEQVWSGALAAQTDMLAQRLWERQRESDLAILQAQTQKHDAVVKQLHDELAERNVWFEQWRTYIHELERELGRPLSGVSPEELPERPADADGAGAPAPASDPADSPHPASTDSSDATTPPA
jgi:SAM-dependent methyltransferase